jgi:2-amino-4-hydroxy-6-hydroxymethyldihydropteridine diphosphokinase
MPRVYLGLGSNLEDRRNNLLSAIGLLAQIEGVVVKDCSSIYETDPLGYLDQPAFLNMVVEIETSLPPLDLLDRCQEIERKLGRKPTVRWGPRTIDLDLLLYGEEKYEGERLTIPHPRLTERAFVVIPLQELGLDSLPGLGMATRELGEKLQRSQRIYLHTPKSEVKCLCWAVFSGSCTGK